MDYLPDSPIVTRSYCPTCEPEADPIAEILEVRYCDPHGPVRDGALDNVVTSQSYMSGSGEGGGEDNRRYCDFFHRKIVDPPAPETVVET